MSSSVADATLSGVTINGDVELASSNNMDASAVADGSAAKGSSETAVGIAIAINVADMENRAELLSGTVNGGFTARASMKDVGGDTAHVFAAEATSGASGGDTGVAGSFALSIADADTAATVGSAATVNAGIEDVSMEAASEGTSTVSATASAESGSTGVGVSIAINVINTLSEAELGAGATLTGGANLTLTAANKGANTTTASGGAVAGNGTGVGGAVSIAVIDQVADAQILVGNALNVTGDVSLGATHEGASNTTADGTAEASTAIGAAIAIGLADDTAETGLARDLTAGGAISLSAQGAGSSSTIANASAEGGESSGGDADSQQNQNTALANQKSAGAGSSNKSSGQSASKGGSSVSVAAAIAVNVANATAQSQIGSGLTVTANGGDLSLISANNMDATATGDGSSATSGSGTSVGVGVAINVANMTNDASIGDNTTLTADGLTLSATMRDMGGDSTHSYITKASSGASGGDTGIAGSFALSVVNSDTTAIFGGSGTTLTLNGGAVALTTENISEHEVLASASALTGGGSSSTGVGAGIALLVAFETTDAHVADGTTINGTASSFEVSATSRFAPTAADQPITTAVAGAQGSTSIGGAVAITYVENTTLARIGAGGGNLALTGGTLSAIADHEATVMTMADGEAAGGNVGVGASVALNIGDDDTDAEIARSVTGAGAVVVTGRAILTSITESRASAKGQSTKKADGTTDSDDSDQEVANNTSFAQSKGGGSNASTQTGAGMFNTGNSSATNESGTGLKSQAGAGGGGNSSGGTSVAATVSVNFLNAEVDAKIADGVTIAASGAVTVGTESLVTAKALAIATSTNTSSNTGVAAAVGLNITLFDANARIGTGANVSGSSVAVQALQPANEKNLFQVRALSGAVSGNTSIGGSISINYIDVAHHAAIGDDATVTASGGDITVAATSPNELQNLSGGAALSRNGTGVGIAVSINIVDDLDTSATVGSSAILGATGAVNVSATASLVPLSDTLGLDTGSQIDDFEIAVTNFAAGIAASGGGTAVGGSAAVNVMTIRTEAHIDDDTVVVAGNGISVTASDTLTLFTAAGSLGLSAGNAGVGVGIDVNVILRDTTAWVGNRASLTTAGGDISVMAGAVEDFTSVAATFGASSSSVAVAVSIAVLVVDSDTEAYVEDGTVGARSVLSAAGGDVTVSASSDTDLLFLAGGVALSLGGAGIGVASAVFVHTDTVSARLGDYTQVLSGGATGLSVTASSSEDILDIAAAAGASGSSVGIGGSVLVAVLSETTEATIGDFADIDAVSPGASAPGVFVQADSDTDMLSVAGALGLSAGGAGIGAGVNVVTIGKTTQALIGADSDVEADGNVVVEAISDENLKTLSVAAAAGTSVGVGIAADVYVLTLTTRAKIDARTNVHAEGSVLVQAIDETEADLIVGGAAVGGSAGIGGGVGVAVVTKITEAAIAANARVTGEGYDTVSARTGKFVIGSGSAKMGLDDSALQVQNGRPDADDLEIGVPDINTETNLYDTKEEEDATTTSDDIDDPGLSNERTATAQVGDFRGVAVTASAKDDIESIAFGFAAGGTVAVAVGAAVNVIDTTTTALIGDGAQINQDVTGVAHADQSVLVAAANDFNHVGIGAGLAIGGTAGAAPGVDVSVVKMTTTAVIGTSVAVDALNDVVVSAEAEESFLIVAAGIAGGGTFAIGGGVAVTTVENITAASIGNSSIVVAGGDVVVTADDDTSLAIITGGVGVGIAAAGIGASVGVVVFDKSTTATIGDSAEIDAKGFGSGVDGILTGDVAGNGDFSTGTAHGVIVQADSSESFLNLAFAGGVGLYVGVAGAVGVTIIDSDTRATIGDNARINRNSADFMGQSVSGNQGVWVGAANRTSLTAATVSLGGGLVGLAGSVSFGTIRNDVSAKIGTGSKISAAGSVEVNALSAKELIGFSMSGALGAGALGGSISVFSIGEAFADRYEDNASQEDGVAMNNEDDALDMGEGNAKDDAGENSASASDNVDQSLTDISGNGDGVANSADSRAQGGLGAALIGGNKTDTAKLDAMLSAPDDTEAGVSAIIEGGSGSEIDAGGNVEATADERIRADFVTGTASAGLGAIGAAITIVNVSSNVRALIGGNISAAGQVNATANGKRDVDMISIGVQAGFVGVGASVGIFNDTSAQRAEISDGAVVNDASSLSVMADNEQDVSSTTFTVQGGVIAAGVNFSRLNLDDGNSGTGDTVARIGNNVQIGQTEAVGDVNVKANSTIDAESETTAVGFGGVAVGFNFSEINVSPQVTATIGTNVQLTATGKVDVEATSSMDAFSNLLGVTVGLAGLGVSYAEANVSPTITASIGSNFRSSSNGLEVTASHNEGSSNRGARAKALAAGGGIVAGQGAIPVANANADVSATIGTGGDIDAGTGDITVSAYLRNLADADADTAAFGGLGIGASVALANANGSATADVNGLITGGANLTVSVTARNKAEATADAAAGGLITAQGAVATATSSPILTSRLDGGATVSGAVIVDVDSEGETNAVTESKAGGLAGVGAGVAVSTMSPMIVSSIGGGTVSANSVTVNAQHNFGSSKRANAKAEAASVAGFGAQLNVSTAVANANLDANIAGGTNIIAPAGVTLTSKGVNRANALTDGLNVGILGAFGVTDSAATASGTSKARILDQGAASATPDFDIGGLTISATSQDTASARTKAASGGLISATNNDADATASPIVEASIGQNMSILANGNVSVTAVATPEADGNTKGASGGGIDVGLSKADVRVSPTVMTRLGAGTVLDASGSVTVSADAEPQSGSTPTYLIESTNTGANAVTVLSHGLETGDVVEYQSNGTPISGLSGQVLDEDLGVLQDRSYNVIRVTDNVVAFGNSFSGANVNEDRDEIDFDQDHNFLNGDRVVLSRLTDDNGVLAGNIESETGSTFFVRVVDSDTIKLVDSLAATADDFIDNTFSSFVPGDISNDGGGGWIDVGTTDFVVGDAVTYISPGGLDFGVAQVDVSESDLQNQSTTGDDLRLTSNSTNNDRIYFVELDGANEGDLKNHGFSNGDRVLYTTDDPDNIALGGLENGRTYRVVNADNVSVQLKRTDTVNTNVYYTRTAGGTDQILRTDGQSWADAGFRSGEEVIVTNAGGNDGTYTISSVNGSVLSLSGTPLSNITRVERTMTVGFTDIDPGAGTDNRQTLTLSSGTWAQAGISSGSVSLQGLPIAGNATVLSVSGAVMTLSTGGTTTSGAIGGAVVQRTSAANDSFDSAVIALNPDKDDDGPGGADMADASTHTLTLFENAPIGPLVDGQVYYVVAESGTQVRLAETPGGAVLSFTIPPTDGNAHRLGVLGIDLTATSANEFYELRIDVQGGLNGANDRLNGPGGVSLAIIAPQAGDGTSSVTVKGSGGGIVSVGTNTGTLKVAPKVTADVSAALVNAGQDVTISSTSGLDVTGNATNGNGGLVAVGNTKIDIDSTDNGRAKAETIIGAGTQIVAGDDFGMTSDFDGDIVASTRSTTGGFVGVANADTEVDAGFDSTSTIGNNAVILVGDYARIATLGAMTGSVSATARGIGFGGDGDADSHYRVNDTNSTVTVGNGAILEATETSLQAGLSDSNIDARADGRGGGFYSEGEARAEARLDGDAHVIVQSNAEVTGWEGVDFIALNEDNRLYSNAFARSTGLFGYVRADGFSRGILEASVNGAADALVTAGPRDEGPAGNLAFFDYAEEPAGAPQRLAFFVQTDTTGSNINSDANASKRSLASGGDNNGSETRTFNNPIAFSSDVLILSGRSPELVVNAAGVITSAINITVNDDVDPLDAIDRTEATSGAIQRDKIYVNDIENPGAGDVAFLSDDSISGSGGTWTFRESAERVTIANASNLDIQINDIDVLEGRQPLVSFNPVTQAAGNVTINFDIEAEVAPSLVEITNTGTGDVELNGVINNPIGTTTIVNTQGSVIATQPRDSSLIRSQTLNIDAASDVGIEGGARVNLDMVESAGVPVAFEFTTGQVSGLTDQIFLGQGNKFYTGQLVQYTAASTPIGGLVSGNFYYVEMSADNQAVTLFDNAGLSGDAVDLSTSGSLANTHSFISAETLTVDAGNDAYLDIRALLRQDVAGDYVVKVDRVAAGDDADVLLRATLEQSGQGFSSGVIVKYPTNEEGVFFQNFRNNVGSPQGLGRGAFATGGTERATTYDFRGLDPDTGVRTLPGLQSGANSGDGNTVVTAAEPDPSDTRINVLGLVEVDTTGATPGEGHTSVLTNGWIALTEISGDFRIGTITSTDDDVLLYSPVSFVDAQNDPNTLAADVTGQNVTLVAASALINPEPAQVPGQVINPTLLASGNSGGIGRADNFLEIDSGTDNAGVLRAFDQLGTSTPGTFIDEVAGDLRIHTVHSLADVALRTVDGAVIDARGDDAANALGQAVDIDAHGAGATIGTSGNELEIDSSRGSTGETGVAAGGDDVALEATGDIYVEEVDGYLRLLLAHSYLGDINLVVRESADLDENLILVESGTARFAEDDTTAPANQADGPRTVANGTIFAEDGFVRLLIGDNVTTSDNADLLAAERIEIVADFQDADAGFGVDVILQGRIIAGADLETAGSQGPLGNPLGVALPTFTAPQHLTTITTGADVDLIQFGDASGVAGTTVQGQDGYVFLGSKTQVFGGEGEDLLQVFYLQDTATVTSPAQLAALTALGHQDAEHTLRLDGQSATDTYEVFTLGSNGPDQRNYIVNALDTGLEDDGVDELFVYGNTTEDDIFLLRQASFLPNEAADNPGYVALVHGDEETYRDTITGNEPSAEVQRISYDTAINGRLSVLGLGGDDAFFVDDTSVITTLDGGAGDDSFEIGQIYGLKRTNADAGLLAQDEFPNLVATTRGFLSAGTNSPLLAQGGSGNDEFTVYSNQSELRLEGGDNDDIFTVRAFALALVDGNGDLILDENGIPQPIIGAAGFSSDRPVDVRTGGGNDEVRYNVNAPVSIEGGAGFDKVVILGTEFADDFVITEDGVLGAGLNVRYDTIEVIEVDGLEGDDEFFVQSTAFGVSYRIIGGLGSDTINVTGDVTEDIVTRELEGAAGAVNHLVSSDDVAYDGLLVDGFDYNVATEEDGLVVIEESGGFTSIFEGGEAFATDSYTVRLAQALTGSQVVYVTVSAARSSQEEQDGTLLNPAPLVGGPGDSFWLSPDAPTNPLLPTEADFQRTVTVDGLPVQVPDRAMVLRFDAGNWADAQTVHLFAVDDDRSEGDVVAVAQHSVISDVEAYDGIAVRNVEVDIRDNDTPGVQILEIDARERAMSGMIVEDQDTTVIEGDATTGLADELFVTLSKAPQVGETVVVNLNLDAAADQDIKLSSTDSRFQIVNGVAQLTFDSTNWDDGVIVIVEARDDARVEDPDGAVIAFALNETATTDASYIFPNLRSGNGLFEVTVLDNDTAGALAQQSGGSTLLIPDDPSTVADDTVTDDYTLRLTGAPEVGTTVDIAILTDGLADVVSVGGVAVTPADYAEIGGLQASEAFRGESSFANQGGVGTISRSGVAEGFGSFISEGFEAGQQIRISDAGSGINGDYVIATVTDLTITLTTSFTAAGTTVAPDGAIATLANVGLFEGNVTTALDADPQFGGEQLVRSDNGSWLADGFLEGQWIRVFEAGIQANFFEAKIELIRGDNEGKDEKLQITEFSALPAWLTDAASDDIRVVRIAPQATFDSSNFWIQQEIELAADTLFEEPISREGAKVFPASAHLLSKLRGPLQVEGGVSGADRSLKNGLKLPGEGDDFLFEINAQAPESQQIDVLNMFNDSSQENGSGVMTETTLTGYGMADTLDFGPGSNNEFGEPVVVPGGISWGRITLGGDGGFSTDEGVSTIEVVNLMLGEGNDRLDITGTLNNVSGVDTTGTFTVTPDGSDGGTISRADIDWLALGFLPGQSVEIDGVDGRWTVASVEDATADPNDNSILVLTGDPLPALTGEITVRAFDALVETAGSFAVATSGAFTTVTRSDGGNWNDDNFLEGHLVRVEGEGIDQSVRLVEISEDGLTLTLENADLPGTAILDLTLSVQGPHGGLTTVHGGGNRLLDLHLDLLAENATETGAVLTRLDGLSWTEDGFTVGAFVQLNGESSTRQIIDIVDADPSLAPGDAFATWGTGAVLILDGGPLDATGTLSGAKIHVSKPGFVETTVTLDLDCCDKGESTLELVSSDLWADIGFFIGQEVTIEGLPGVSIVQSIDGNTMIVANENVGLPIEGEVSVSGFNPRIDGGKLVGGDHFVVTGGAGPDSPLVIYGDTSQDGNWYAGQPNNVLGYDFGEKPFDPFPNLPDGDNEDDEWVMPLANPFDFAGNDIIDASALFADRASTDLPSVGITAYGGAGDDLIIGSQTGDHLAGGSGNDTILGQRGSDHAYGDSGVNVDIFTRALFITTVDGSPAPTLNGAAISDGTVLQPAPSPVRDDLTAGTDLIFGDGEGSAEGGATAEDAAFRDIIFGDHGRVEQLVKDPNLPPVLLQKIQTTTLDTVTEIVGVGTDNGANDFLMGGEGQDILMGGAGDDRIETGLLQNLRDVVFGDNGRVTLNGSESFDGPSEEDETGEEFTTLSFNFDSRPGQSTVDDVAGTDQSVSTTGIPAPRDETWNNLVNLSGTFGNEAGEFILDDNGADVRGIDVSWRVKKNNEPIYDDPIRDDGFGYTDANYGGEDIFLDDEDYEDPSRFDEKQRTRGDAHNQLPNGVNSDNSLFEGYLFTSRTNTIELVVEGLDTHFSEYDIYIYLDADNGRTAREGDAVRVVSIGPGNSYFVSDPRGVHFDGTYIQATSQDPNAPTQGNYVAQGGLTDGRVVVEITAPEDALQRTRPVIAGFQIVGRSHPIDRAESVDLEGGGNDAIYTGGGDDLVFGGTGNDWIDTAGDADVGHLDFDNVFGDNGRATLKLVDPIESDADDRMGDLREMESLEISEAFSFDDIIITGNGEDAVIGGQGNDCIETGDTGIHNAVDDALSGADISTIGINFASGESESFVEGRLGYVSADGWNNIDNGDLGDFNDPTDGLNDENGFKGNEAERYTTAEGATILVGRDLDSDRPRRVFTDPNLAVNPDTQNGRLYNGFIKSGNPFVMGVDMGNIEQALGTAAPYDVYLYVGSGLEDRRFDPDIRLIGGDGTEFTTDDRRPTEFRGEFVAFDPANPLTPANVVIFRNVVGDNFSVRIAGSDVDGDNDQRNLVTLAGLQIVGGADKDNIVPQGDFDSDRVLGDQGEIRLLDREVYDMRSESTGVTNAVDKITTGDDGDVVVGGDGADFIYGEDGDDVFAGDNAVIRLFDGEVIQINIADEAKRFPSALVTAPDFDPFAATGVQLIAADVGFDDTIDLGRGDDWAFGGGGDDSYIFAGSRLGSDTLVEAGTFDNTTDPDDDGDGQPGVDIPAGLLNDTGDVLDFSNFHTSVNVRLQVTESRAYSDQTTLGDLDGTLKLFSGDAFEDIVGTEFDDFLRANNRGNAIMGLGGDDEIQTGGGNDFVDAGSGNDLIWMGLDADDDDFFVPGATAETVWRHVGLGGDGNDIFYLSNGIDLVDGGDGNDRLFGGGFDGESGPSSQPGDVLFGGDGNDLLEGGRGIDTVVGEGGADFLRAGLGDTELEASLNPALRDTLIADRLAAFDLAAGRSDFIFVAAPGEGLEAKVAPFVATIPAPVPCPEHALLNLTAATAPAEDAPEILDTLEQREAEIVLDAAKALWIESGHLDGSQIAALNAASVAVTDLDGLTLANAGAHMVRVDADAAGHGWFVDVSPAYVAGFEPDDAGVLRAVPGSEAEGHMDLLSVLTHELGHVLGYNHIETHDPSHVMNETLEIGTRFDAPTVEVFDPVTGSFTDADTARGLAAMGEMMEPAMLASTNLALPGSGTDERDHRDTQSIASDIVIQWRGGASGFMHRLSAFFGR
ncbi:MAG: hypothetical protein AAFQ54_11870 [Pseudomonadota bacterium]